MSNADSGEDLKRALSHSKALVPAHLVVLVFVAIICVLLEAFSSPPRWLHVILLGAGAFGLAGDVINILYCRRKLRALREEDHARAHS